MPVFTLGTSPGDEGSLRAVLPVRSCTSSTAPGSPPATPSQTECEEVRDVLAGGPMSAVRQPWRSPVHSPVADTTVPGPLSGPSRRGFAGPPGRRQRGDALPQGGRCPHGARRQRDRLVVGAATGARPPVPVLLRAVEALFAGGVGRHLRRRRQGLARCTRRRGGRGHRRWPGRRGAASSRQAECRRGGPLPASVRSLPVGSRPRPARPGTATPRRSCGGRRATPASCSSMPSRLPRGGPASAPVARTSPSSHCTPPRPSTSPAIEEEPAGSADSSTATRYDRSS